jgi:hypothetical protein
MTVFYVVKLRYGLILQTVSTYPVLMYVAELLTMIMSIIMMMMMSMG